MGRNSRERHEAKRRTARDVEQILDRAIQAHHRAARVEVERCRAALVAGPGGAAGVQIVNRVLLTCLLSEVAAAWRRGWQPAELVRVARRGYGARHGQLATDVIAAQMRGHPRATVDHRWQAQLATLDAQVWWQHDDEYATCWGERHGLDRGAVIATVIEVLHLLATLPGIEPVGPMPGTATAEAAPSAELDQRMLDRIRALLAKAESTDFPEEADAFTAKAQELMARHRIDHALLVARTGERDQPVTRRLGIDNPYEAPKALLLQVVAEANSCRAVWAKRFGFTTVVGFPADLESTELLFTSLLVQATRAMTLAKASRDRYGRNTTRSFRHSFLTAYASRIGERLGEATGSVDREMAASVGAAQLLPVLAARDDAVRDAFEKQFPDRTQHAAAVSNREGWASGRAAADQASLHRGQALTR
jgi:Protein of unknown function (DUF2786)